MSRDIMQQIEARNVDKDRSIGEFEVGDTVDVKVKISEGDKTRIQNFSGTVIARCHSGLREMFTVRRLVDGEGVERTFPLHSPHIAGIEVKRKGVVRRAKLYYLRDRVGKATRLREKREEFVAPTAAEAGAAADAKKGRKRGAKAKAERKARAAAEGAAKASAKNAGKSKKAETAAAEPQG